MSNYEKYLPSSSNASISHNSPPTDTTKISAAASINAIKINNLPLVGNPPTNNLRESNSVGGVRFHRFSSGDGTALVLGAEGGGTSINGPPTTATGTLAAIAEGVAAVGAGCCSRAEEIVRGLHGARGGGVGPFPEPPARTCGSSTMPCCGLDVMLDGGASMLSAEAAVMSNNFISAEDKIIIMSSNNA